METKNNTKKLKIILGIIYLFFSIVIFSSNIFYPKFTLTVSYGINNTIFSTYNFFYNLPNLYKTYISTTKYIKGLEKECNELKEELSTLKSCAAKNTLLTHENEELKQLLFLIKQVNFFNLKNLITAQVINKNLSNNTSIITLKAGTNNGVVNNLAVIANNSLIGRTIDSTETFTKVILLNNKNSKVPVYTKNSKINAIMVGNNTNKITLISYEKKLLFKEGEILFTSGLGGMFPRNIPIGTIYKDNGLWLVKPFNNFNNISYVHIVTTTIKKQV